MEIPSVNAHGAAVGCRKLSGKLVIDSCIRTFAVMGSEPWGAWYHCMCNTYGTWLRGDRLGWRERHHRKHVDGDYKNRPKKGTFEELLKHSKSLMKRDPVHLDKELRRIALLKIIETLAEDGVAVLVACLDNKHLHVLGQFKDKRPRIKIGWAKFYATKEAKKFLKAHGAAVGLTLELKEGEGIWGKRSESVPIEDKSHRLNSLKYIASHWKKGSLVWLNPKLPRYIPTIA